MTCDDVERHAEAYADGELDLERALAFEAHVAGCAACASRLERTRALARTLQAAPYFHAPDGLADRLRLVATDAVAAAPGKPQTSVPSRRPHWQPWLLSAASFAVVAFAFVAVRHERATVIDDTTTEAVIEGHVRSLMAAHLTDVTSSDRHTVKPWFAGRVDFSPTVVDLVGDGFPLAGGRLDYIDRHAAAALVYTRREHTINVFIWPQANGSSSHVTRSDPRGYRVISWTRGGVAVWVVSDLALAELGDFAGKLDAAMQG